LPGAISAQTAEAARASATAIAHERARRPHGDAVIRRPGTWLSPVIEAISDGGR
jgi:muconolactone delta-isomerase